MKNALRPHSRFRQSSVALHLESDHPGIVSRRAAFFPGGLLLLRNVSRVGDGAFAGAVFQFRPWW